jgi:hypothetical protein
VKEILIGRTAEGKDLRLNIERLVETRLLIQSNSGGGKSWAMRRILEQTHGKVQQLVIDVEDEFHTLREKFDYVLAGSKGADCPADVKSAALLAHRLLELNVSAIIGIFELKAHDRIRFVRLFLDALVNAPRDLWHPVLVVLDEAHMFCPQHGDAESAGAVIDLMTRGRKRGFCGILATQRISKLHKDAAAEANNKLIGRSALDVDMRRSADELGFSSREDQAGLRTLKPGQFFCFGPAISDTVIQATVGDIKTTHPRAGQHSAPPAPPQDKVRAVLAKLADLPHVAEQEAQTVQNLQARIRDLERELRAKPKDPVPAPPKRIEIPIIKDSHVARLEKVAERLHAVGTIATEVSREMVALISKAAQLMKPKPILNPYNKPVIIKHIPNLEKLPIRVLPVCSDVSPIGSNGSLSKAERLMLTALAQYPDGRSKAQVGILTGYSSSSGTFGTYLGKLRTLELVSGRGDEIKASADLFD